MTELIQPRAHFCRECDVPAEYVCACESHLIYICQGHLERHLSRDNEHPIRVYNESEAPDFDIFDDIEALERSGIEVRGHSRPITSILVIGDELITSEKDGIYKWDIRDKSLIKRYPQPCQVWCMSYSKPSSLIAAGLDDGKLIILDSDSGQVKYSHTHHNRSIIQVKFNHQGNLVISGCNEGLLVIHSLERHKLVSKTKIFRRTCAIVAIAITHDDKYAVVSAFRYEDDPANFSKPRLVLWNIAESRKHCKVDETETIVAIHCTSDNRIVYGGYEGCIRCYDVAMKKEEFKIDVEKKKIYSIVVTNDSKFIYVSDNHNWINKYDLKTKEDLSSNFDCDYLLGLTFDESEKKIYSILGGRSVRVFEADEEITRLNTIGHDLLVSVKITNDQNYIVGFYLNGGVIFFDSKSGTISNYYESFSEGWELFEKYPELGVQLDDEEIDYN